MRRKTSLLVDLVALAFSFTAARATIEKAFATRLPLAEDECALGSPSFVSCRLEACALSAANEPMPPPRAETAMLARFIFSLREMSSTSETFCPIEAIASELYERVSYRRKEAIGESKPAGLKD